MTMKNMTAALVAVLAVGLTASRVAADPLRLDFSQSTVGGAAPLQAGWLGFTSEAGPDSHAYPNDELAGVGNSVTVTVSGQCCSRDYAPATSIFEPISDLLRDGPLLNGPGTMTLRIDGLLDGNYVIHTYHHTTQFGGSARPPATPFDIELTDGVVTDSVVATGLTASDNASAALSMQVIPVEVSVGSSVVIDFIRGENLGLGDHFALPAIEIFTPGNPPPPIELSPLPDPPTTDVLKVDFAKNGSPVLGRQDGFHAFVSDSATDGGADSDTQTFAYDHGAGGTVDVSLSGGLVDTGSFVYRNYAAATGMFEPLSALLSDGPLVNAPGTLTLGLANLEDGLYEITLYHHTTAFGPNHVNGTDVRGPATPFDILLTDGNVTGALMGDDVEMSDNMSLGLSTSTFQFSVAGGSPVSIDLVRGTSVGGDDHMALPGFELHQIPEPASCVLLGIGWVMLCAGRRREARRIEQ